MHPFHKGSQTCVAPDATRAPHRRSFPAGVNYSVAPPVGQESTQIKQAKIAAASMPNIQPTRTNSMYISVYSKSMYISVYSNSMYISVVYKCIFKLVYLFRECINAD